MTMINVKMMLLSHFIFSKKKNKKGEWNTKYSVPQLMIAKKVFKYKSSFKLHVHWNRVTKL